MKLLLDTLRLIILIVSIPAYIHSFDKAVVIVPVADLVGSPMSTFGIAHKTQTAYELLACAGGTHNGENGCPRVHQLLFGEQVTIIKDDGDEWCIRIPQAFFITHALTKPQTIYWTLKENLMPLNQIKNKQKLPPSINFADPRSITAQGVATLKTPWRHEESNRTFSIGTRFTYTQKDTDPEHITIALFDPLKKTFTDACIKTDQCIIKTPENHAEQRQLYLSLLKEWAHQPNGHAIPYVWGGRSALTTCDPGAFKESPLAIPSKMKTTVFTRAHHPTGFDCAGLIMQAAQMSGIPFFYKNTHTMGAYLAPLQEGQEILSGDIIWMRGHVLVAHVESNTVIEARGYTSGYGIVHEIALEKVFMGIKTFDDFLRALFHKIPLQRLDSKGLPTDIVIDYKVLKLASVWDNPLVKKGA